VVVAIRTGVIFLITTTMTGYDLSRNWFDWAFEHPEKINPNHSALYFFIIEHCNRLGWRQKFGLPTTMAKEAIGMRSYNTYIKTLNDLIEFGFIELIEKSKNQYSSNIIAISNFDKALDKALDKAIINHITKQDESTGESNDSINKPETNKPIKQNKQSINERKQLFYLSLSKFLNEYSENMINDFFNYWSEHGDNDKKMRFEKQTTFGISQRLKTWQRNEKTNFNNPKKINHEQHDKIIEAIRITGKRF
jgi:hypothetical protein